jgi:predicted metal-binding protein
VTTSPSPSSRDAATPSAIPSPVTTILVCTTCRREGDTLATPRAGERLHAALEAAAEERGDVRIVPVECLSVCKRPVTIGFGAPEKWTYVYGDFDADAAPAILDAAALYGAASDGLIPWKSRPDAFKKGVVARIPPLFARSEARS